MIFENYYVLCGVGGITFSVYITSILKLFKMSNKLPMVCYKALGSFNMHMHKQAAGIYKQRPNGCFVGETGSIILIKRIEKWKMYIEQDKYQQNGPNQPLLLCLRKLTLHSAKTIVQSALCYLLKVFLKVIQILIYRICEIQLGQTQLCFVM